MNDEVVVSSANLKRALINFHRVNNRESHSVSLVSPEGFEDVFLVGSTPENLAIYVSCPTEKRGVVESSYSLNSLKEVVDRADKKDNIRITNSGVFSRERDLAAASHDAWSNPFDEKLFLQAYSTQTSWAKISWDQARRFAKFAEKKNKHSRVMFGATSSGVVATDSITGHVNFFQKHMPEGHKVCNDSFSHGNPSLECFSKGFIKAFGMNGKKNGDVHVGITENGLFIFVFEAAGGVKTYVIVEPLPSEQGHTKNWTKIFEQLNIGTYVFSVDRDLLWETFEKMYASVYLDDDGYDDGSDFFPLTMTVGNENVAVSVPNQDDVEPVFVKLDKSEVSETITITVDAKRFISHILEGATKNKFLPRETRDVFHVYAHDDTGKVRVSKWCIGGEEMYIASMTV